MLDGSGHLAIQGHQVSVGGRRMHYLRAGEGDPCVLLHGLLGTADAWRPCMLRLSTERKVFAPDALGIGCSERVSGLDTSLDGAAGRLLRFFDKAAISQADLVGTSHGGALALQFAAMYPERVKSLVLHAPANPYSKEADLLIRFYQSRLGRWFAARVPEMPEFMQSIALGRMYGNPARIENGTLHRYIAPLSIPGTVEYVLSVLSGWSADMRRLEEVLDRLEETPALILWGTHDRAVSIESGYKLLRHLKRADFALLPGTGHLPFEEMPETFSDLISRFLDSQRKIESAQRKRARPFLVRAESLRSGETDPKAPDTKRAAS